MIRYGQHPEVHRREYNPSRTPELGALQPMIAVLLLVHLAIRKATVVVEISIHFHTRFYRFDSFLNQQLQNAGQFESRDSFDRLISAFVCLLP